MPNIITLTGPSGSGKSLILKMIEENAGDYCILPKYTTRKPRKDDDKGIIPVDTLPEDCDYRYTQYGKEYGFSSKQIYDYLRQGKKPVIIVNDENVLEQLHSKFGASINSYFIHRSKPSLQQLMDICHERGVTDPDIIASRFKVAREIYKMYTDRIGLFNNIILNTSSISNTEKIVARLFHEEGAQKERVSFAKGNKIFIIAGNAGSGKDFIIKAANRVGCVQVPKHTTRFRNPDDGSEMICKNDKDFDLDRCDIQYTRYGTIYGIDTNDIWKNLICGNSHQVIVCSDIDTIKALKAKFGESVVTLYVHSDITREEFSEQESRQNSSRDYIQARVSRFYVAHDEHTNNIELYDKCLIYANDEKELLRQFAGVLGVNLSERHVQEKEIREK